MSAAEKHTVDDSESATLKSATGSLQNDKAREAGSMREGSQVETRTADPSADKDNGELKRVHSTAKEAKDELTRVMTSGEGVEYPTGLKLNLISLALCLSVFLMALVRTLTYISDQRLTMLL